MRQSCSVRHEQLHTAPLSRDKVAQQNRAIKLQVWHRSKPGLVGHGSTWGLGVAELRTVVWVLIRVFIAELFAPLSAAVYNRNFNMLISGYWLYNVASVLSSWICGILWCCSLELLVTYLIFRTFNNQVGSAGQRPPGRVGSWVKVPSLPVKSLATADAPCRSGTPWPRWTASRQIRTYSSHPPTSSAPVTCCLRHVTREHKYEADSDA